MTRHSEIEKWIVSQIEGGELQVGDKLPSESELCRRFGVSRHTVRIAISNLTSAGWI